MTQTLNCTTNFIQVNGQVTLVDNSIPGVEIMPLSQGLEECQEIREAFGSVFNYLEKPFPQKPVGGYLIWVKAEAQVENPIQTCFYLTENGFAQFPHNLILVEQGASVQVVNMCSDQACGAGGVHSGCTELVVRKGGRLNYTMVHSWNPEIVVRPMTGAMVEEDGQLQSSFISFKPTKSVKMNPTTVLKGARSRALSRSVIFSADKSSQDVGSRIILEGEQSQGEISSHTVCATGEVTTRGYLEARGKDVKGHLECHGLILNSGAKIHSIPELLSNQNESELSHEASIGRLNPEQIEYLQSRGLSYTQALNLLLRSFLSTTEIQLPASFAAEIEQMKQFALEGIFNDI
ncbi:MAG: SufD family Fe-S cluster assembly protein [Patescibacteria group bacterium]